MTAQGPFEILEILGEGSFGTVCVARVTGDPLRRKVALKILKGAYASNRKILNRTRDEARLLSRISHPNIVRVERLMDVGGRPVVVMEHVRGVSLDRLLLRFKEGLPGSIAIEVTRQTCLALHVAYNETSTEDGRPMRVIHRDMKPSNIMLSVHGEVKVVDFGIAKGDFEGREAETESVVMGSRPYMAPERLDGVPDTPAVDVYSAGMSLFELITGRTMTLSINPVNHGQAMTRQLKHVRVEGMSEEGERELRELIRRMCAYDRGDRPTAVEAGRDLEQCLFAIDAEKRIGLEEFARTTVLPIYDSRPRVTPEDATSEQTMESEFLKEVTGHLTGAHARRRAQPNALYVWTPYVFVGVLAFLVVVLGTLAVIKVMNASEQVSSAQAAAVPSDGMARVKMWIPSDAQAQVGEVFLSTASTIAIYPGPTLAEIYFNDGSVWNCTFTAADGIAVRYVVEDGSGALSVDDGAGQKCMLVNGPVDAGRGAVAAPSVSGTKGTAPASGAASDKSAPEAVSPPAGGGG